MHGLSEWISLLLVSAAALQSGVNGCPEELKLKQRISNGKIDSTGGQNEISGVSMSPTLKVNGDDVIWVISDSGAPRHVVAYSVKGGPRLAVVNIEAGMLDLGHDMEDLATGPCSAKDRSTCLFVSDFGNNGARTSQGVDGSTTQFIYRFQEPTLPPTIDPAEPVTINLGQSDVAAIKYQYGDSKADAESFMVDPISGDMFIVTKWDRDDRGRVRLFRIPEGTSGGNANNLVLQPINLGPLKVATWTGGDISKDGSMIVIRSEAKAFFWERKPGQTIQQALAQTHCFELNRPNVGGTQHEAIAFGKQVTQVIEIPEGVDRDIFFSTLTISGVELDDNPVDNNNNNNDDTNHGWNVCANILLVVLSTILLL